MAPKIKTSQEDIIAAAIGIVREKGIEAVNARSIAARLGCSIQPVFRTFGTMDEVKAAVYKRGNEIYEAAMEKGLMSGGFSAMGLAYVHFAKNEPNIFRMLFVSSAFYQGRAADIIGSTKGDSDVIELLCKATGLDAAKSKELYTCLWLMVHGIASLLVSNSDAFTEDEIKRVLSNTYDGLVYALGGGVAE